jgi:hypothetical protein
MTAAGFKYGIEFVAGVIGLAASACWLLAARGQPAPAQGAYSNVVDSPDMPFHRKWRRAAAMNQWAAGLTGVSTLLLSIAALL